MNRAKLRNIFGLAWAVSYFGSFVILVLPHLANAQEADDRSDLFSNRGFASSIVESRDKIAGADAFEAQRKARERRKQIERAREDWARENPDEPYPGDEPDEFDDSELINRMRQDHSMKDNSAVDTKTATAAKESGGGQTGILPIDQQDKVLTFNSKVAGVPGKLTALISASSTDHLKTHLSSLNAALKKRVDIRDVHVIGNPLTLAAPDVIDQVKALAKAKVVVDAVPELPPHMQYAYSPVWIVRLADETKVYEGDFKLEAMFDNTGRFLEPQITNPVQAP